MYIMRKIIVFLFVFSLLQTGKLFSQADSLSKPVKNPKLCEIKMMDGTSYKGHIDGQTDSLIYLKSSAGVIVIIPKHNVASIDFLNGHVTHDTTGTKKGMTIHTAGIANRYYTTTSNAFLFNKGEIYGSNSYFVFGNINYAFSRNFSFGVSSSVIAAPMGAILRGNFELSHKLYLGIEGKISSLTYINQKTYATTGTLKLTYGDEHRNFTFYGGYFDAEDWIVPKRRRRRAGPTTTTPGNFYLVYTSAYAGVSFSSRLSEKVHFVADASYYPGVEGLIASIGLRSSAKQKISWIGGFQYTKATLPMGNGPLAIINNGIILPYVGFSYRL